MTLAELREAIKFIRDNPGTNKYKDAEQIRKLILEYMNDEELMNLIAHYFQ